jgi:anti-sigma F factor
MSSTNEMKIEFDSRSCNEGFARVAVASFLTQLDPTLEEVSDVKTAVSEAVTNCIIHGYDNEVHKINIECRIINNEIEIVIIDTGKGIENIEQALEPLFTTKPELERSGMGFAFMEAFMDKVEVISKVGQGTSVYMKRVIGNIIPQDVDRKEE